MNGRGEPFVRACRALHIRETISSDAPWGAGPWLRERAKWEMWVRTPRWAASRIGAWLTCISCCCLPTLARADGFDAQRLHIAPDRATGFIAVRSARTAGKRAYNVSLWVETLADPLVLTDTNGKQFASVVDNRLDLHFLFAYGFTDWLELGLDVPVTLAQTGDEVSGADFPGDDAKAALGPVRLVPRAELVQQRDDDTGFGLGLYVDLSLPSGEQKDFRSDGLKVEPGG